MKPFGVSNENQLRESLEQIARLRLDNELRLGLLKLLKGGLLRSECNVAADPKAPKIIWMAQDDVCDGQVSSACRHDMQKATLALVEERKIAFGIVAGKAWPAVWFIAAEYVTTNDISIRSVKGATDGGTAAKDTDPILERTNGATDKSLRLSWASASVIEIQMPPVAYPPDLDDAQPIVVNILAAMKAGSVDAPVITVSAWEGVGDTNMGGDTAAVSTALQKLTVALAATDVGVYPKFLTIGLKPGAHATASNDAYVYAVWLEYTRKA